MGDTSSKEGVNRAERGDTGPLNPAEAKKAQKGWGESMLYTLSLAEVILLLILVQLLQVVILEAARSESGCQIPS